MHTKLWRGTIRSDKIFSSESLSRLKYSLRNSERIDISLVEIGSVTINLDDVKYCMPTPYVAPKTSLSGKSNGL